MASGDVAAAAAGWRTLLASCPPSPDVVTFVLDPRAAPHLGGGDAAMLLDRAEAAAQKGDLAAVAMALAAAALLDGGADTLAALGQLLERREDVERAERAYGQALARAAAAAPTARLEPRVPIVEPFEHAACADDDGLVLATRTHLVRWDLGIGVDVARVRLASPASALAASPDAATAYIAVANPAVIENGRVVVPAGSSVVAMDLATGASRWTVPTAQRGYSRGGGVAITSDGRTIVTADGRTLRTLDAATGAVKATIVTSVDGLERVVVTPDGKLAAAASSHGLVLVDLGTATERAARPAAGSMIGALAMTASGDAIATWDTSGTVAVHRGPTLAPTVAKVSTFMAVGALAFAANGAVIAIDKDRKRHTIIGEQVATTQLALGKGRFYDAFDAVALCGGERLVAVGDGGLIVGPQTSLATTPAIREAGADAASLDFSPDGRALALGMQSPVVWSELGDPRVVHGGSGWQTTFRYGTARWLASHELLVARADSLVVIDPDSGASRRMLPGSPKTALSADRRRIASALDGKRAVAVFGPDGGARIDIQLGDDVTDLALSHDGELVAIAMHDGLAVYSASTGKQHAVVPDDGFTSAGLLAFEAEGHVLVYPTRRGMDHDLVRRDVDAGRELARLRMPATPSKLATWRGGLIVGFDTGEIGLWDRAGRSIGTLDGHTRYIAALGIAPARPLLASSSWDGTLRLWDLERRVPVAVAALQPEQRTSDWGASSSENARGDLRWLVLASDGRVDGSPDARGAIAWKVGAIYLPGAVAWARNKTSALMSRLLAQ